MAAGKCRALVGTGGQATLRHSGKDYPIAVGDEALLFGDPTLGAPPVEAWADAANTINYEIVTRIGPRAVRREVAR